MTSQRSLFPFTASAGIAPTGRTGWRAVPLLWRKRLAVLLAALTVPAMAATGGVGTLPGPAVESTAALATRRAAAAALPFERPGMSFPGSAFFYMADPAGTPLVALPKADPLAAGGEAGRELGALIDVGAPARPFFSAGVGLTHARAQECLAQAVWYEAASESEAGQRAVAQVVLNRVAHPAWPNSVCGVVYQGSERRTGCQFTFTCDGSLARRPSGTTWARAQRIAAEALAGSVYAPVGHATHYHTLWVNPYWAGSLDHLGTIGAHRFYRLRGGTGEKNAFTMAYAGLESRPSQRAPSTVSSLPEAVPALPVIAYDLGPAPARAATPKSAAAAPVAPASTAATPALSGTGAVKAEYARAGQWKARPGEAPAPAAPAPAPTESS
ncbi:MAG: cell wall hydrolase [Erythrobacter sp.]|nr:cell wall hydrolase [Erythrobacter sp.]